MGIRVPERTPVSCKLHELRTPVLRWEDGVEPLESPPRSGAERLESRSRQPSSRSRMPVMSAEVRMAETKLLALEHAVVSVRRCLESQDRGLMDRRDLTET